jgi:hypothetical protein
LQIAAQTHNFLSFFLSVFFPSLRPTTAAEDDVTERTESVCFFLHSIFVFFFFFFKCLSSVWDNCWQFLQHSRISSRFKVAADSWRRSNNWRDDWLITLFTVSFQRCNFSASSSSWTSP